MTALPDLSLQALSEQLHAGDQLGRYQLLCPVAHGGMGQVWAGRETGRLGLPRLVAIKTALPQGRATYDKVEELFLDEAQVAAAIDHPNVCKILELGQEGSTVFIVMEWIHGESLHTLLRASASSRRLDFGVAAQIVFQACSGLHAAHELKDEEGVPLEVVHRDATPHNLLITTSGEVKIIDFGIVKSRNQLHQSTQAGEIKGKIAYLAPEQVRGMGIDRRSDIFSLGCVLYLATTGRGPFNANDAGSTIMRILQGDYKSPSALVPNYPKRLEQIVARALAPNPADRFQTCEELRSALEVFMNELESGASRADLAVLLEQHCGSGIEQRRAQIRNAQKLFESQGGGSRAGWDRAESARSGTYPVGDPVTDVPRACESGAPTQSLGNTASASHPVAVPSSAVRRSRARLSGAFVATIAVLSIGALSVWRFLPRLATGASAHEALASGAAPSQSRASIQPLDSDATYAREAIEINVQAMPTSALLSVDDGPPLPTPRKFSVPADGKPHALLLRAPGYEDHRRVLSFDKSQSIYLELLPKQVKREPAPRFRPWAARASARLAGPAAHASPAEPAQASTPAASPSAPKDPFNEPLTRQPPRRAIDESDPFGNQP